MNEPVRLMRPYIGFDEVEADFRAIFASGQFTRGPYVDAFVNDILNYTGSQHAFLATSATTALWLSLKCLGVSAGDEVAVSDFSFPATANVVEDLGATPIFVDVDLDTFNMSLADLAAKIGPKTKAVMFVDALGNPTGLHEIQELCRRHNLPLIEDAACAIGSTERGVRCGSIADITCFSFHPRKLLNTGEGGAITTNRGEWADWLRVKLMHGASGMRGLGLDFVEFGYNFRLPELQAVMGSKQLAQLDDIVAERNSVREAYVKQLAPMGFIPQEIGHDVRHNVQSLVFRVPAHLDRDALVRFLDAHDIEATLGTYCMSGTTYFARKYDDVQPRSQQLEKTTITLPCYKDVPVARVCDEIARFAESGRWEHKLITSALFLGSKKFGLEIFKAIYNADKRVTWAVLCPPDENDIRTHIEEFRSFSEEENLEFAIAKSPQTVLQFARDRRPDVVIVCGYYRLLPDEIFQEVRDGVWGIHNSLLPKYRGGSPLVWQIINGEETIGSSFFKFASGVDDGPVLEQVALQNDQTLTIKEATDLIELEWIRRLPRIWEGFCEGSTEAKEQDHSKATYCSLRQEFDGKIDWHKDARSIDRFVRAQATPYPRAFFILGDKKIRIVQHEVDSRVIYGTVGQVFEIGKDHVTVCCGQSSGMRLIEFEVDGKTVAAADVLNSIKIRI